MKNLFKIFLVSVLCAYSINLQIYADVQALASPVLGQESYALSDLVDNFKQYTTTNIDFHAGNLYEHSIWVALAINQWIEKNDVWCQGLDDHDKKLAMLAGLLHDVGKAGDLDFCFYTKPGHELEGLMYILGKKTFYLSKNYVFNFDKFFKNLGLSDQDKTLVAILVGAHAEFGELLKLIPNDLNSLKNKDLIESQIALFIKRIKNIFDVAGYKKSLDTRLIKLIVLICAADVKGSARVDLSFPLKIFNFSIIKNPEIVHCEALDNFNHFAYGTKGKKIREFLLGFCK